MRVLVCGGRDFYDWEFFSYSLQKLLDYIDPNELTIISGAAKGADTLALRFAYECRCQIKEYPADWKKYGRKAGPIRNQQMLDEGKPDLVVAFPGGRGTADMIKRSKTANVPVIEVKYESS